MAQDNLGDWRDGHHPRDSPLRGSTRTSANPRHRHLRRLGYYLDPSGGLRHLTLTTAAIIKAAEFWAFLRQSGIPTASPDALDGDAILAGQAALAGQPGDTVTIATTNLAHLNRFPGIDAQTWDQIR